MHSLYIFCLIHMLYVQSLTVHISPFLLTQYYVSCLCMILRFFPYRSCLFSTFSVIFNSYIPYTRSAYVPHGWFLRKSLLSMHTCLITLLLRLFIIQYFVDTLLSMNDSAVNSLFLMHGSFHRFASIDERGMSGTSLLASG